MPDRLFLVAALATLSLALLPVFSVGQEKPTERETKYHRYADSLIKQYDNDKNGKLDQSELSKMRRPPSISIDKDGDEMISRNELADFFSPTPKASSKSTQRKSTSNQNTSSNINVRMALIGIQGDDPVDLQNFRLKSDQVSFVKFADQVAALQNKSSVTVHELVELDAVNKKQTRLVSGGQTPVKSNVATSRSGEKLYQYQNLETGFIFEITPQTVGGSIELKLALEKSFVEESSESSDEHFVPASVKKFEFNSSISVGQGEVKTVSCQQAGQHWILLISATNKDIRKITMLEKQLDTFTNAKSEQRKEAAKKMQQQMLEAMKKRARSAEGSSRSSRGGNRNDRGRN